MDSDNPSGADDQQETADGEASGGILRDWTWGSGARQLRPFRPEATPVKVQSDPHGDMGSWAEMTRSVPD